MFGEFGLLRALSGAAGMSAPAIAAHLQKAAVDHTPGALRDDLAVVAVRCRPAAGVGAARPKS